MLGVGLLDPPKGGPGTPPCQGVLDRRRQWGLSIEGAGGGPGERREQLAEVMSARPS